MWSDPDPDSTQRDHTLASGQPHNTESGTDSFPGGYTHYLTDAHLDTGTHSHKNTNASSTSIPHCSGHRDTHPNVASTGP